MHIAGAISGGMGFGALKSIPIGLLLITLHLFDRLRCVAQKPPIEWEINLNLTDKHGNYWSMARFAW